MTGVQISAMRIPDLADPAAQLFLWAPSRQIGDASLLMNTWGFRYRGLFVWCKPLGMGRHMRHSVEFLLWGGRPGAKLVEPKHCPVQLHHWPKPRRHSEKPPEAYRLIRQLSDPPRLDLFARQHRPGFQPWGNEVGKLDG
jgi:N6-adenosine-specific RNA methylase IME4